MFNSQEKVPEHINGRIQEIQRLHNQNFIQAIPYNNIEAPIYQQLYPFLQHSNNSNQTYPQPLQQYQNQQYNYPLYYPAVPTNYSNISTINYSIITTTYSIITITIAITALIQLY